ncbi:MAG: phosphomannomutase [Candidatus Moranbacteria bacterium]|nr:phosphomannomutase [Candidatus Moranbacteria bacterium]
MKINPHIFRGYDIRGVVGKDLDFEIVRRIAQGYAYFLSQRRIKQAVVGYDCRLSGPEFSKAVIQGLTESGIETVDLGMCLTQMVYFAQYHYKVNGGVMITASHNPADYNGMKLACGFSNTLITEEIQDLRKMVEQGKKVENVQKAEVIPSQGLIEAYYQDLLKRVSLEKQFKLVVDASNGTTGKFAPEFFQKAGLKVVANNVKVDGSFPLGTPDPTEEEILNRLAQAVTENQADLGVAYDGDGDRLGVVDELGRVIWADVLTAIFADDILDFLPGGKIVYNVLCSKLVDEVIKKKGEPIMHKTGHSFIKQKVANERALFGGELSGHFFFMDNYYGHDDAFFATLRLLEYLGRKKQKLSEIIDNFPKYISSPEIKLGCADDKKVELIDNRIRKKLEKEFKQEKITTIDGVRVDFEHSMLVIRYSQNGPYITIKFEAKTKERYNELKKYLVDLLEKYSEIKWDQGVNTEALN